MFKSRHYSISKLCYPKYSKVKLLHHHSSQVYSIFPLAGFTTWKMQLNFDATCLTLLFACSLNTDKYVNFHRVKMETALMVESLQKHGQASSVVCLGFSYVPPGPCTLQKSKSNVTVLEASKCICICKDRVSVCYNSYREISKTVISYHFLKSLTNHLPLFPLPPQILTCFTCSDLPNCTRHNSTVGGGNQFP